MAVGCMTWLVLGVPELCPLSSVYGAPFFNTTTARLQSSRQKCPNKLPGPINLQGSPPWRLPAWLTAHCQSSGQHRLWANCALPCLPSGARGAAAEQQGRGCTQGCRTSLPACPRLAQAKDPSLSLPHQLLPARSRGGVRTLPGPQPPAASQTSAVPPCLTGGQKGAALGQREGRSDSELGPWVGLWPTSCTSPASSPTAWGGGFQKADGGFCSPLLPEREEGRPAGRGASFQAQVRPPVCPGTLSQAWESGQLLAGEEEAPPLAAGAVAPPALLPCT